MEKLAVVTDSVACIPYKLAAQYNVHIIPAGNIYYDGKIFRDLIELDHNNVYELLDSRPEDFFTGPTSPVEFLNTFRELSLNANIILYVSLSSKFSTLYNSARAAKDLAKTELPGINIEIIDSRTATAAQGFVALAAARAAMENKSLTEIMEYAKRVRNRVDLFYVIETVKYVYRTGRVPKAVSQIGSRLNVRPIVTVRNGSARVRGLVRNKGKGMESLLELARKSIGDRPVHIAVLHTDSPDEAESLRKLIDNEFQCVELWVSQFSPLMAYATGRGVIGIAFYVVD